MTGPQLATLSTALWAILTVAFLIVFGRWSAGESWSILPGLVRGVRDWASEHAASRSTSPSPWAVAASRGSSPAAGTEPAPPEAAEAEVEELGTRTLPD
jgi:hypothetical protein